MDLMGPVKTAIKQIPRLTAIATTKAVEHAPLVLSITGTGLGVGAVITGIRAGRRLQRFEDMEGVELPWKSKLKYYVWPLALGAGSLACFHGALFVQFKRTAQVAAACATAEGLIATYQDGMADTLENGTKPEKAALQRQDERTFKETVEKAEAEFDALPGNGDVIFIDGVTGFAFRADEASIRMAEKFVVEGMQECATTYLSEFYSQMGVRYDGVLGLMIGWNDHTRQPKIFFSAQYMPGSHPVCVMHYNAQILDETSGHPVVGTEIRDDRRM